jgi:hypothetical protein
VVAVCGPEIAHAGGPTNNTFPGTPLGGPLPTTVSGSNELASKQAGEPATIGENANDGGASVWWSWTASSTGKIEVSTCDSSFNTLLGVYTGDTLPVSLVADNDNASCNGLPSLRSRVVFTATAGTAYRILVDGHDPQGTPANDPAIGSIGLTIRVPNVPPPANDALSSPSTVPDILGSMFSDDVDTTTATKEAGENNHAGSPGGHSVWFDWTAPVDGKYAVNTCGVAMDTLLALYADPGAPGPFPLAQIAAADDSPGVCSPGNENDAVVTFFAQAGDNFKIAVDGKNGDTAEAVGVVLVLLENGLSAPPNDAFAAAQGLAGTQASVPGSTLAATAEPGEPDHFPSTSPTFPRRSVWYSWTAPSAGETTVSMCNGPVPLDFVLGVYTGTGISALNRVASDDNSCPGQIGPSRVTFQATAGTTYGIAVDNYGVGGDFLLEVAHRPAGDSPACVAARAAIESAEAKLKKAKKKLKKAKQAGNAAKVKKAKKAVKKAKQNVKQAQAAVDAACAAGAS